MVILRKWNQRTTGLRIVGVMIGNLMIGNVQDGLKDSQGSKFPLFIVSSSGTILADSLMPNNVGKRIDSADATGTTVVQDFSTELSAIATAQTGRWIRRFAKRIGKLINDDDTVRDTLIYFHPCAEYNGVQNGHFIAV